MQATRESQRIEAEALKDKLADYGLLAMWGGGSPHFGRSCKGHGFWLHPASPEAIKRYNDAHGYTHLDDVGEPLQNDGKASGNPYFWMFKDAQALLTSLEVA